MSNPLILTDELTGADAIQIPALPRPTLKELRSKYAWIRKKGQIEADTSPIEAVTLRLGTVLCPNEEWIHGRQYEYRRASVTGRFGYQQLAWLVRRQDKYPAFKALLDMISIDGTGITVVHHDGRRAFPYLTKARTRWCLRWIWVGEILDRSNRLALSDR